MGFEWKRLAACAAFVLAMPVCGQPELPVPLADSGRVQVVSLLGASVTAGYAGRPFSFDGERSGTARLQEVLEGLWDSAAVSVRDRSDMATFIDPLTKQRPRLRRVLRDEPDLVVAIDFMFWFGYGPVRGNERGARLEKQQEGFALLEQLDCPVLVGDYPDMRGADTRILRPSYIPSPEVLAVLNERLHAWISVRNSAHLFPLADWVQRAVKVGEVIVHEDRQLQVPPLGLLQQDRLHANRLGMALMGYRIGEQLAEIFVAGSALRPRQVTIEEMVQRCRADLEISELAPPRPEKVPAQRDR